jgi:hypothetical protein
LPSVRWIRRWMLLLHAKWKPAGTFVFPPAPPLGAAVTSGVAGAAGALSGYLGGSGF